MKNILFNWKGGDVDMWDQEIYIWLESYAGVTFDFSDDFEIIKGDTIFIEPYLWIITINEILEHLEEAVGCIEKYGDDLPDDMPRKKDLKKFVTMSVLSSILTNLNSIKKKLNIEEVDINNFDTLIRHVETMHDLVVMLTENPIEDVLKNRMFEKHEEENDESFYELFEISKNDIPNMSFTVNSIRDAYLESLDN